MAKGRKAGAKGTIVTLKMAKNTMRVTPDGRRRLDLSNMGIATFPKCLLKFANALDSLDLSRNRLRKLPDSIGDMRSLQSLDLHTNQLEEIPDTIGRLVALSHLDLSNNRLTSAGVPPSLGSLSGLRSLNLGLNRLDTLPPSMVALVGLQELGLFDNLLDQLPDFVKVLPSLVKLNTKRNPLMDTQGEGEAALSGLYLVKETDLCGSCLETWKEERRGKRGGVDGESRRWYSGLITPNSVAMTTQDVWRRR